jgi:hypothetical protein
MSTLGKENVYGNSNAKGEELEPLALTSDWQDRGGMRIF